MRIPRWFFCCFFLPGFLSAADWPQWRGPDANGISTESLPQEPDFEKVLWKQKISTGFSSLAVANGKAYTMGHSEPGTETVWAFNAETGKPAWSDTYPAPLIDRFYEGGPGATPTVRHEKIYTFSKHGRLHCYDANTGDRLWERDMLAEAGLRNPPEWGFASSPFFVNDDMLLIEAGATFALNPQTGQVLWKSDDYTPAYGSPASFTHDDKTLVATLKSEGLVVLDAENGKTIAFAPWETPFNTNATTPIITADGRLFISTGYDRGCALFSLDASAGQLTKLYENPTMSNHMNNCVLINDHLYGFDGTAHRGRPTEFVCMELDTGKETWRLKPAEGLGCGSLMAANSGKTLLILSEKGELLSAPASPAAFEWTTRAQVLGGRCWTVPVLANNRIYCRNAKGDLVCIKAD
jgi:outer membrane protein assembly factor BamB